LDKVTKNLGLILMASAVVGLSACSSKPSPWTQQSSPWSNRDAQVEEAPVEDMQPMAEEQSPFVDQAAANESMMEAEPVGAMVEEELPMVPPMEEPMMVDEPMMVEEPMMMASGGDIRSQPPGYFAVQVVASSSMKNLLAFAKRNGFSEQWTAETNVNGVTWYVLLQGIYPTMADAKAALAEVSANLDTRPWIRSVGSLQSVMMQ
jgi:septal ring-binding cell division protein DamX